MAGWIKSNMFQDDVGPGVRSSVVVGGNIAARGPVKWSGSKVVQAAANDPDAVGMLVENESKILNDEAAIAFGGVVTGNAESIINDGESVKVGLNGTIAPALTIALAGQVIEDNVGLGFANQPANDSVEVVSSSALDTMPLDIYGTTNGGLTVVKERVVLTGTTQVVTVKTDWGVILGVEIPEGYPTSQGTLTIREGSANATIITMSAGVRQRGVVNVPRAQQRAFGHIIGVVADSGTTKTVGIEGVNAAGSTVREAVVLTGATAVPFTGQYRHVTKILVGDLESARTATFRTDSKIDGSAVIIGRALTDAIAGAPVDFLFTKQDHRGLLTVATAPSIPISNTTTETAFSNASFTIPANLLQPGKVIRVRAQGILTATNSTDTLTVRAKLGSTTLLTLAGADAVDNDTFDLECEIFARAAPGGTAAVVAAGTYSIGAPGTATRRHGSLGTTNFATNGDLVLSITSQWSAASTSDSVRCDIFSVEIK